MSHAPMPSAEALAEPMRSRWSPSIFDAELGVPDHFRVMRGIAVGVRGNPDEVPGRDREREQRERSRRPLAEFAYGASWGQPWGRD